MSGAPSAASAIQPWEVLGESTLVKDRWIDLRVERCRLPSGADVDDYHVQLRSGELGHGLHAAAALSAVLHRPDLFGQPPFAPGASA